MSSILADQYRSRMSPNAGEGGDLRVSASEYMCCAHEAKINCGDLTSYLTYDLRLFFSSNRTGDHPSQVIF
jgi:hypothetical protein